MKKFITSILLCSALYNTVGQHADTSVVLSHLKAIVKEFPNRNCNNTESLNGCAQYIYDTFEKFGDSTYFQEFEVQKNTYKNVITTFGPRDAKRLIVGAHYDVCGNQDGADDNASGVVGLLELARLLDSLPLNYRIDLVAYSLEEPPYFRTQNMGSYIHAKSIIEQDVEVFGMVCLEMIGFFSDDKNSQRYPIKLLKMFYGNRGDYITVVKKLRAGKLPRIFNRIFKRQKLLKTKTFSAPSSLTGIDFSDHLNYWEFDIPAVMITNTGFYRNYNYHQKTDTIESLDIGKMTAVIQQLFQTIQELNDRKKVTKL